MRCTVSSPRPNDLVAVGVDQFILTNSGTAQTYLFNTFEYLSGYRGGTVYFWDGKVSRPQFLLSRNWIIFIYELVLQESHELLSGLGGPNGIEYDKKNSKLFVSELNYNRIHAYDIFKVCKT